MMLAWPDANLQLHSDEEDAEKDLQLLCDWCEGQILFGEESAISLSKIVELMKEYNVSCVETECWFFAESAFLRLKQRHESMTKNSPIIFGADYAELRTGVPHTALRFCCMLALGDVFANLRSNAFKPHSIKGFLFELLAAEALNNLFPKWKTSRTGWTPDEPKNIGALVKLLSEELHELEGNYEHWSSRHAKDEGLDLFCYYPFNDIHSGFPTFLFQCATGANWRGKTSTPNIDQWTKLIQFTYSPKRAFIVPFALTDRDYRLNCLKVDGPLLDRYRLLSFDKNEKEWLSNQLADQLETWLVERIARLPIVE